MDIFGFYLMNKSENYTKDMNRDEIVIKFKKKYCNIFNQNEDSIEDIFDKIYIEDDYKGNLVNYNKKTLLNVDICLL